MTPRAVSRKKQRERFLLERFFEAAALSAEIVEEREAPDFMVLFEGRLIGAEVTELFISHDTSQNVAQAQESIAAKIVSRGQEIYQTSGGSPARVSICFNSWCDLRNINRERVASDLAAFVMNLNLTEWQRVDWRPGSFERSLPDEISFVHALGLPGSVATHWVRVRAGWVAPLTAVMLQPRVDEKASRLSNYQSAMGENWLVIVADSMNTSQMIEAKPDFDPIGISSPFSRTFFYRYPGNTVVELGCK